MPQTTTSLPLALSGWGVNLAAPWAQNLLPWSSRRSDEVQLSQVGGWVYLLFLLECARVTGSEMSMSRSKPDTSTIPLDLAPVPKPAGIAKATRKESHDDLSCATNDDLAAYDSYGPHLLFRDIDKLTDWLKSEGHILHVAKEGDVYKIPVSTPAYTRELQGERLFRICGVQSLPSPSGSLVTPEISGKPLCAWATKSLIEEVNEKLADETQDVRKLSMWPVRRAFVYVDVSDFSQRIAAEQAIIINTLTTLTRKKEYWSSILEAETRQNVEDQLCIGDGYIIVFKKSIDATYYAARLADKIEKYIAEKQLVIHFHFRIGVHVGEVYRFWDYWRAKWNYIGDGINGGNRVLAAIGKDADDMIFVSGDVREELRSELSPIAYPLIRIMSNRGRRSDKHGGMWRVYELRHTEVDAE